MRRSYRCYHIEEGVVVVFADGHGIQALLEIEHTFFFIDASEHIGDVFCIEGDVDIGALHGSRHSLFCIADVGVVGGYVDLSLGEVEPYDVVLVGTGNQGYAVDSRIEEFCVNRDFCGEVLRYDAGLVREGSLYEAGGHV